MSTIGRKQTEDSQEFDGAISKFIEICDGGDVPASLRTAVFGEVRRLRRRRVILRSLLGVALASGVGVMAWRGVSPSVPPGETAVAPAALADAGDAAIICPHGASEPARVVASSSSHNVRLHEFLQNPDRFHRVCYCRPSYSGSLR